MTHDPLTVFPEFYRNHTIRSLAKSPRWTVVDSENVPINFRELLDTGRVHGAHEISNDSLVTLDELTQELPQAANCAFYLRSHVDRVVMLIIDATCPGHVAQQIHKIPSFYSEYQLNGGTSQHVFSLPKNINNFPAVKNRKRLVEPHGWYEIVLEGWVAFSRDSMPAHIAPVTEDVKAAEPAWTRLFGETAAKTRHSRALANEVRLERPNVRLLTQILDYLTRKPLEVVVADFHGDLVLYEYEVLHVLLERLQPILKVLGTDTPDTVIPASAEAWLIAEAAKRLIPDRNAGRDGVDDSPLLFSAATSVVSTRELFTDTSAT